MNLQDKLREQRSALTQQALDYLKKTLYAENPEECPDYYLYLNLAEGDKEYNLEKYYENLKIFKALFASNNPSFKIALWNSICVRYEGQKLIEEDFSQEEYAFLVKACSAQVRSVDETNINKPIITSRLVLRSIEKDDMKLFAYHYKNDGDFVTFTGYAPRTQYISFYANRRGPNLFTIEEKNTHTVIGYVGLSIHEVSATGLLEYYIFKEFRQKGYCKEAIAALVERALKNKLYLPVETVQVGVYAKRVIKLNAIRARIATTNSASLKTVQSCGFLHEATIHKSMHKSGLGWLDEEIYYLPKDLQG